jgi:meso-butanediol dehydrogenase / (S,S)-butanediol dehydrogenase / diacetyl reductase
VTEVEPLLSGRRAFLTGAGSGIGAAVARRFCEAGAAVAVTDVDARAAAELADRLRGDGHVAYDSELDVTDEACVVDVLAESVQRLGGLDTVVANAGTLHVGRVEETDVVQFERVLRVNTVGTFLTLRHSVSHLSPQGGVMLCTASQAGLVGAPELSAYCASKFAVVGLVQSLARELAGQGIRVAAVAPGLVRTEMLDAFFQERARVRGTSAGKIEQEAIEQVPAGRTAEPNEVADVLAFLASDQASYISGVTVPIDGGELSG